MKLKSAFLGAATAAATLTAATVAVQPAHAAGLQYGSVLNFTSIPNGGVQFNNAQNRLNFFSDNPPPGNMTGQIVRPTASTGSFLGTQTVPNQSPPPPRILDILLSGSGQVRNFASTVPVPNFVPANVLLSGINAPGIAGNPNVAFVVQQLTYNTQSQIAQFRGSFFRTTGTGVNGDPLVLGQLLSAGTGSITSQGNANAPGFASFSGSITAVPTPALLPSLIGFGVAALRKRKGEAVTEVETAEVKA
ncbi:PTPA-CTERM sorting domain-containing protein [Leptolyngbya sp. FACHB-17]|uniref:PTPA-CTERM sorting domain-containing protein n=1 Tax=unclassified Leptolyngbya TaxID=2650499 RepID=UPI001681B9F6|nr:PTPA-CTERM sorting domain-containing protein [Leptolyngbya sp. FACHB-17]MBD2081294.1 PTPA-CTERM sorting domain-containing protein [Leptolyngbya sp. FACHB-17]